MADIEMTSLINEALESFQRRATANGRTFDQEVQNVLKANRKFTPEERVAVSTFSDRNTPSCSRH